MPEMLPKLFRGFSKDKKSGPSLAEDTKKLKEALLLTADRPDGVADISGCRLKTLPPGFLDICESYAKIKIICSHNNLDTLSDSKSSVSSLSRVKSLDASFNRIENLPMNFEILFASLIEVRLNNNCLSTLPESFKSLRSINLLHLQANHFSEFPIVICDLLTLEELDVTNNAIHDVPSRISCLKKLSIFRYDEDKIQSVPKAQDDPKEDSVRSEETNTNMAADLRGGAKTCNSLSEIYDEERRVQSAVSRMKNEEAKERQSFVDIYRTLEQESALLSQLINQTEMKNSKDARTFLKELESAEEKYHQLSTQAETRNQSFVDLVREMESHSEQVYDLVRKLADDRSKHITDLARQDTEFDVSWRELAKRVDAIKQDELAASLSAQLEESGKHELFFRNLMAAAQSSVEDFIRSHRAEESLCDSVMKKCKTEQDRIISLISTDEELQKKLFFELQLKADIRHQGICRDLAILESELCALSNIERNRVESEGAVIKEFLEDDRRRLLDLYERLTQEKKKREEELLNHMKAIEMEAARCEKNFWLAQYGWLMERIPESVVVPLKTAVTSSELPEKLRMEKSCVICLDKETAQVFVPCGHVCCCVECSDGVSECPLCRARIDRRLALSISS